MPYLNKTAFEVILNYYPNYGKIHEEVFVKIKDFFLEEDLRNIRHKHLNKMIKIKGVVTRRYF
jgi:DNA replication licensing factor MCM2